MDFFNETNENSSNITDDKKEDTMMIIFVILFSCMFLYYCCVDLEINKLYTIKNSFFNKHKCPICFEHSKKYAVLKCHHSFCKECIDKWLEKNKTCPLCREEIL